MKKLKVLSIILLVIFFMVGCNGGKAAESKVLKVGTEPTFPPFEYMDEATGEIDGFDIALITAMAEKAGYTVEIMNVGFDGLVPALQSGNINIIASGMSITPERAESVTFTEPYIDAGLIIAVKADNQDINGEADLAGKIAAVQIGTTGADKANELKDAGLLKEVKTYNTIDVAFLDLANGAVDCVINDAPVTEAYMSKNADKIKTVGDVLVSDQYGFAVAKENTDLAEELNTALKQLKEEGTFDKFVSEYFGS